MFKGGGKLKEVSRKEGKGRVNQTIEHSLLKGGKAI